MRLGWATGTFVCHDPDQHGCGRAFSAWNQSGGRLTQVSMAQLRPARGHKRFLPTESDWEFLEKLKSQPEEELADAAHAREFNQNVLILDESGLLAFLAPMKRSRNQRWCLWRT